MSNKQLRNLLRVFHLCAGIMILALVYAEPARQSATFITLTQLVVTPVIALTGIAMWQQATVARLRRSAAPKAS